MTTNLILSLNLVKWLLIWLAVKVIVKKQLSQNTATAIHHTCNGIVSLCWHLLATSHKYVLLGQFLTDPLEKNLVNFTEDQVKPISLMFNNVLKSCILSRLIYF